MRAHWLLVLALVLLVGCGGGKTASVSGTITMDGQPVANAQVNFQPNPASGELNPGPGSFGRTNEKGEYSLELVGGGSGAIVGWHKVTVRPMGKSDPKTQKMMTYVIKSGESKFEVKPGSNTANFEVSGK
jgi:hypothetical protein